jgi:hypothetical protein
MYGFQKDMEVLMKTNINPVFFLYQSLHRKPDTISESFSGNKSQYARKMTMICRQLIYESTADDVFWVLPSKLQREKPLEKLL